MRKQNTSKAQILPILTEVFREYGYNACSLSIISKHTGLGKSSLYHFFPNGKKEMLETVLKSIEQWFEANVFTELEKCSDPYQGICHMIDNCSDYFHSGQRACLLGALSLSLCDDEFKKASSEYFQRWHQAIVTALESHHIYHAQAISESILCEIQGAITLTKSLDDANLFSRRMVDLKSRIQSALNHYALHSH